MTNIDDYLRFYVPLKNISFMETSPGCKIRPMLGAQGLSAGREHLL
jgi:hypothetical protein